MSVGRNLQEMENVVTKGAASAEPMHSIAQNPSGVMIPGQTGAWEDLGGPTPQNYRSDDNSAVLKTPGATLAQVKNVVNAKASAPDPMKSLAKEEVEDEEEDLVDTEEETDEDEVVAEASKKEEEEEEEEEEEVGNRPIFISKPIQRKSENVFVDCAIRQKVIENFNELLENNELSNQLEESLLHVISDQAIKENMDIDWSNRVFWNMYRSKAITLYENLKGIGSYVQNNEDWITKIKKGEISIRDFAELSAVELCPKRWKDALEKQLENEKKLQSKNNTASIFMWCSGCKKKSKCDYYQMQTRSADEPMTTFMTCLECDRRWKF